MPLIAGVVTLAAVVLGFVLLLPYLMRRTPDTPDAAAVAQEIGQRRTAAKRALREGKYHQAFREIDAAKELSDRQPAALGRDERRELEQLHRQSELLARLLNAPLQDIVKEAALAQEDEWRTRFAELYQGRGVLFDDVLRADAGGRLGLGTYEVRLGEEKVRLAVEELHVLRHLPLDPPPRVLFGARLAKVAHEAGGWVIRFDPDSGVLFTDPDAAGCVPLDAELLKVLEWQKMQPRP